MCIFACTFVYSWSLVLSCDVCHSLIFSISRTDPMTSSVVALSLSLYLSISLSHTHTHTHTHDYRTKKDPSESSVSRPSTTSHHIIPKTKNNHPKPIRPPNTHLHNRIRENLRLWPRAHKTLPLVQFLKIPLHGRVLLLPPMLRPPHFHEPQNTTHRNIRVREFVGEQEVAVSGARVDPRGESAKATRNFAHLAEGEGVSGAW
jgi:hypothetical protein